MHVAFPYKACATLLSWVCLTGLADAPDRPAHWQGSDRARPGYEASRSARLLERDMLEIHNAARRAVGSKSLEWDTDLAREATAYARELARTSRFAHSRHQDRSGAQGENLWRGTRGFYRYDEMVSHWVGERPYYTGGDMTVAIAKTAGHYTQIIWADTTHVGCGLASSRDHDVLVCRYSPPGNILGQHPMR